MKKFFSVLFIMIFFCSFAFARGTLISGSEVDVTSNNPEYGNYNLLATWAVTPARSDYITITSNQVEGDFQLENDIRVDFQTTEYQQVFEVSSQIREHLFLPQSQVQSETFFYWNFFGGETKEQLCEQKIAEFLLDKTNFPGISYPSYVGTGSCTVYFVLVEEKSGWIGKVNDNEIYYSQKIDFGDKGTIILEKTSESDRPTGKISGVASATLLGFNGWTFAKLSERDIWAYHRENSDVWQVFEDTTGTTRYEDLAADLKYEMSRASINTVTVNTILGNMRNEVTRLQSKSGSTPTAWLGKSGNIQTAGNEIIVDLTYDSYVAEIQLLMSGEKFGLFRPIGEAKILSIDSCSVVETENAFLKYSIQNIANVEDSFTTSLSCSGGTITGDSSQVEINGFATYNGNMRLSGKSTSNDDTSYVCSFKVSNSDGDTKTQNINCLLEAKDSCVRGQEQQPYLDGNVYVVNVLDDDCSILSTKTCDASTSNFKKINGFYECIKKDGSSGSTNSGDEGFNKPLFFVALILGLFGAIMSWVFIPDFDNKYMQIVKVIIFFIVLAAIMLGVAYIWSIIVETFSFGSVFS